MKLKSYDQYMGEKLTDFNFASGYLTEAWKESGDVFLLALKRVINSFSNNALRAPIIKIERNWITLIFSFPFNLL